MPDADGERAVEAVVGLLVPLARRVRVGWDGSGDWLAVFEGPPAEEGSRVEVAGGTQTKRRYGRSWMWRAHGVRRKLLEFSRSRREVEDAAIC